MRDREKSTPMHGSTNSTIVVVVVVVVAHHFEVQFELTFAMITFSPIFPL